MKHTLILFLCLCFLPAQGQEVCFHNRPDNFQLYPRNGAGYGQVEISGEIRSGNYPTIYIHLDRENERVATYPVAIQNKADKKIFRTLIPLKAELANYTFSYQLHPDSTAVLLAEQVVSGDVFLIAGQSNSVASGNSVCKEEIHPFFRTLGTTRKKEGYLPQDTIWGIANSQGCSYGKPFFNGYSAHVLHSLVGQHQQVPTAIINMGVGGTRISENLPSEEDPMDLNTIYGSGLYRTRQAGLDQAVRALIWLQGESNQKTGYDRYMEDFARLYAGWKRDYPNLEKIYMSQIHTGCGENEHGAELREAQRRIGQLYPDIDLIANVGLPLRPDDCHYTREAHDTLWHRFYNLIARDFYRQPGEYLASPDVTEVCYTDPECSTLCITFDQPVVWPEEISAEMLAYLFLNEKKEYIKVEEVYTLPEASDSIFLKLQQARSVQALTYGPDGFVKDKEGNLIRYAGPWITNLKGIPALTFDQVKVKGFTMY
ncbi:MAG: sialate O-acetylesterase [Bacteroides sp.]|nr:sialate O-acetylesterase [Bacteroides sp.]